MKCQLLIFIFAFVSVKTFAKPENEKGKSSTIPVIEVQPVLLGTTSTTTTTTKSPDGLQTIHISEKKAENAASKGCFGVGSGCEKDSQCCSQICYIRQPSLNKIGSCVQPTPPPPPTTFTTLEPPTSQPSSETSTTKESYLYPEALFQAKGMTSMEKNRNKMSTQAKVTPMQSMIKPHSVHSEIVYNNNYQSQMSQSQELNAQAIQKLIDLLKKSMSTTTPPPLQPQMMMQRPMRRTMEVENLGFIDTHNHPIGSSNINENHKHDQNADLPVGIRNILHDINEAARENREYKHSPELPPPMMMKGMGNSSGGLNKEQNQGPDIGEQLSVLLSPKQSPKMMVETKGINRLRRSLDDEFNDISRDGGDEGKGNPTDGPWMDVGSCARTGTICIQDKDCCSRNCIPSGSDINSKRHCVDSTAEVKSDDNFTPEIPPDMVGKDGLMVKNSTKVFRNADGAYVITWKEIVDEGDGRKEGLITDDNQLREQPKTTSTTTTTKRPPATRPRRINPAINRIPGSGYPPNLPGFGGVAGIGGYSGHMSSGLMSRPTRWPSKYDFTKCIKQWNPCTHYRECCSGVCGDSDGKNECLPNFYRSPKVVLTPRPQPSFQHMKVVNGRWMPIMPGR